MPVIAKYREKKTADDAGRPVGGAARILLSRLVNIERVARNVVLLVLAGATRTALLPKNARPNTRVKRARQRPAAALAQLRRAHGQHYGQAAADEHDGVDRAER